MLIGASNQNVAQTSLPLPTQAPSTAGPQMSEEGNEDSDTDPYAPADVDLSDPNKHGRLCAASINNPNMALQHYNGRKHQRNHSRQQLLQDLGNDRVQGNPTLHLGPECCFNVSGCSQAMRFIRLW